MIETIYKLSGDYSEYEIFSDFVKASAISISNSTELIHGDVWKKREREYMELSIKYGEKIKIFGYMLGMLSYALEENIEDVLGKIYMEAGLGSKQTGQFFTPFHVSYLTANLNLENVDGKEKIILNEPSSGGGGLIIASAKVLKEKGFDYKKIMDVTARDIDWKGVYMTYVQLSLLGISAKVIQGDALASNQPKEEQIFLTPAYKGVIL